MKWFIIGIMLFSMGCVTLKNNTYPKPCENNPLKFNKKTGLYECVNIDCFKDLTNKNSNWYKLSTSQLIHFLGKPQEKKEYQNIQIFLYKTDENTCKFGPFVRQSFGLLKIGFKDNKMEYASTISLVEPEPLP